MKITVKLFAFFRQDRFTVQEMNTDQISKVSDVLDWLDIVVEEVGVTLINSKHCHIETPLQEGDVLAIFPVIGGG